MAESVVFKDMDLLEVKRTKAAAGEAKFCCALTDEVCKKLKWKGKRIELHFKVKFLDLTGCAHLESYLTSGATKGTLTVNYNPEAKQEPIPGTEPTPKQRKLHEV